MRTLRKLIFVLLLFFSINITVKAATISASITAGPDVKYIGGLGNSEYTFSNGMKGYCMSPNKPHGGTYTGSEINPRGNIYHLALAVGYTKLANNGYITASSLNGGYVSALFRLISAYYGALDETPVTNPNGTLYNGGTADDPYHVKQNLKLENGDAWNNAAGQAVYNMFVQTINAVNNAGGNNVGEKYNSLMANGNLLNPTFSVSGTPSTKNVTNKNGNTKVDVTFSLNSSVSDVNWNSFSKGTANKLTHNSGSSFTARVNPGVTSFTITASFNAFKYTDNRIYIVSNSTASDSFQQMIMVDSSKKTYTKDVTINVNAPTPDPGTPPASSTPCTYIDTAAGRVYYSILGLPVSSADDWRAVCVHSCQYYGGNYLCKSSDPDANGRVCSKEEYINECTYCGQNKAYCTSNPTTPDCQSYWQECPNCNPSVSMPSSCSDFNVNSNLKGTISDINEKQTSCNYSVKPVKGCVIGGSDIAGNKYEVEEYLKDNDYCRVYCYEQYNFNVPTARHTTSGGYFNLNMQVTGTRSCYLGPVKNEYNYYGSLSSEKVNFKKFLEDVKDLKKQLNNILYPQSKNQDKYGEMYPGYKDPTRPKELTMSDKAKAADIIKKLNKKISDYKACATVENQWANNFNFNPTITYEYQEYKGKYSTGTFKKISESTVSNKNMFCYGKTDNSYNCIEDPNSPLKKYTGSRYEWDKYYYERERQRYLRQYFENLEKNYGVTYEGNYNDLSYVIETTEDVPSNENYYVELSYPKCEVTYVRRYGDHNPYPEGTYQHERFEQRNTIQDIRINCSTGKTKINPIVGASKIISKTATYSPNRNFYTYHQYGTVTDGDPCRGTGYNNCLWTRLPDTALPVELKTGKGAFPFRLFVSNIGQYSNNALGRLVGNGNSVLNKYNALDATKKCSVNENTNNGPRNNFPTLTQEAGYVCAYINNCDSCGVSCSGANCAIKDTCTGTNCPVSCRTCIFDGTNTRYKYRTISVNNVFPNSCSKTNSNCRSEGYNWYYKSSGSSTRPVNNKATVTVKEIEDKGESVYDTPEYSYTLTPAHLSQIRQYNRAVKSYENTVTNTGANALVCDQVNYKGIQYSVRCKSTFLRESKNEGVYFKTNAINNNFKLWTESGYCPNGNCLSIDNGIGPSWK